MTVAHVSCFPATDGVHRYPSALDVMAVINLGELLDMSFRTLPGAIGYIGPDGSVEELAHAQWLVHSGECLLVITADGKTYLTGEDGLYTYMRERNQMPLMDVTSSALNRPLRPVRRRRTSAPVDPDLESLLMEDDQIARNNRTP